jgi:hypothetical protein
MDVNGKLHAALALIHIKSPCSKCTGDWRSIRAALPLPEIEPVFTVVIETVLFVTLCYLMEKLQWTVKSPLN